MKNNLPVRIYLDDVRTPKLEPEVGEWIVVRNYDEFVEKVNEIGLENIDIISLDHDLGDTAISEYYNAKKNYSVDYSKIHEKTGYDCAKWLVEKFYDLYPKRTQMSLDKKRGQPIKFPTVYTHSANPIGSANIIGYINCFLANEAQPQTCVRVLIPHSI